MSISSIRSARQSGRGTTRSSLPIRSQTAYHRSGTWIHTLALMLIGVFVLIYLGLGYFRLMAG